MFKKKGQIKLNLNQLAALRVTYSLCLSLVTVEGNVAGDVDKLIPGLFMRLIEQHLKTKESITVFISNNN